MPPEPNWLLSSAAQSAAAIVAIVAGFLVSRLLSLSSERVAVLRRLRDVENERAQAMQRVEALNSEILEEDAADFVNTILDELVAARGEIDFEALMQKGEHRGHTAKELAPYVTSAAESVKSAFHVFGDQPFNDRVYELVKGEFKEGRKRTAMMEPGLLATTKDPVVRASFEATRIQLEGQRYDRLLRDRDSVRASCDWLAMQRRELEGQVTELIAPQGIKSGFAVLVYFALVGIVVPLGMMPAAPDTFTAAQRWLVFGLFVTGLLAVLIYLGVSAWELSGEVAQGVAKPTAHLSLNGTARTDANAQKPAQK